jgi:uncharacterized protein YbaP (TraB family)
LKQINADLADTMINDYRNEDVNSLYAMTTAKDAMSEYTKKILLDNRNENWVKIMPGMMQKEGVFFAVGAAHLAGELGLINLLKKAGYTVKPIMN